MRAFRSFALGDRERRKRATVALERNPGRVTPVTALEVAVFRDDLEGARDFARLLTGAGNSPDVRGLGHRLLARTHAATGRWSAAAAALDSAAPFDSVAALELRGLLAGAVSEIAPPPARAAVLRQVTAWTPAAERRPDESHSAAHAGVHPHLRLHRQGLLLAALGDAAAAERAAAEIERLPLPPQAPAVAARVLAQSVRANAAFRGGRAADALRILEQTPWAAVAFAFEAEVNDRFLRAEALRALGRGAEARGWYKSIAERAAYELVYLAPSELRLAELDDRRGDAAGALRHYRRFVELWADAEPALQPAVDRARARIAALGAPRRHDRGPR
jgi:tetratricopeptide (TPR) repeat protein